MKTILLSIHKEHFDALLDGRKLHEFRRRFSINEPFQVVFYVSSPIKAICGVALFDIPIYTSINKLASIIKTHNHSSEENLRSYLIGLEKAYALPLKKIKSIKPISLETLRNSLGKFTPPQSYSYVTFDKFKSILNKLNLYYNLKKDITLTSFPN